MISVVFEIFVAKAAGSVDGINNVIIVVQLRWQKDGGPESSTRVTFPPPIGRAT